jgi:hypothetical protein
MKKKITNKNFYMKTPQIFVGFFVLNNKIFVYLWKIKNMNLKTRLTLAMWALPFPFIFIVFGKTIPIIATGVILMGLQMLIWGKLLSEVK